MAVKVNCENLNRKRRVDLAGIRRKARRALRALGVNDMELNLVFVSDQKIRAMNRKYLKRDRATDVIAFSQVLEEFRGKGPGGLIYGDVFISTDRAARNAAEYGTSYRHETVLYVVHGILHVVGYRDGTGKEKNRMRRKEDELLEKIR